MYKVGDRVVYSSLGVFEITDERPEQVFGATAVYYELKAIDEPTASLIFVPKGSPIEKSAMRPLISKERALEIISHASELAPAEWIKENRARANFSKSVIDGGDHEKIISLIKAIDKVQKERIDEGKKPFLQDSHLRERAVKLILSELSLVLGLDEAELREKMII